MDHDLDPVILVEFLTQRDGTNCKKCGASAALTDVCCLSVFGVSLNIWWFPNLD